MLRTFILVACGAVVAVLLGYAAYVNRLRSVIPPPELDVWPDSVSSAAPGLGKLLEKTWMSQEGDATLLYTQMFRVYASTKNSGLLTSKGIVFSLGFAWTIRGMDELSKAYEAPGQREEMKQIAPYLEELRATWENRRK